MKNKIKSSFVTLTVILGAVLASQAFAFEGVEKIYKTEAEIRAIPVVEMSFITVSGSAAKTMYESLKKVPVRTDGGKMGPGIYCAPTTRDISSDNYVCSLGVTPEGETLPNIPLGPTSPAATGTN